MTLYNLETLARRNAKRRQRWAILLIILAVFTAFFSSRP